MLSIIRTRATLKLDLHVQGSVLGDLGFYGKRCVSLTLSLEIPLNCLFVAPSSFILRRRYVLQAKLVCANHLTGVEQTTTSLWKSEDAIATKASVNMPTHH